jgi:hypothetical protein
MSSSALFLSVVRIREAETRETPTLRCVTPNFADLDTDPMQFPCLANHKNHCGMGVISTRAHTQYGLLHGSPGCVIPMHLASMNDQGIGVYHCRLLAWQGLILGESEN